MKFDGKYIERNLSMQSLELSVAQLVRFLVVDPIHPGSITRLGTGAHVF